MDMSTRSNLVLGAEQKAAATRGLAQVTRVTPPRVRRGHPPQITVSTTRLRGPSPTWWTPENRLEIIEVLLDPAGLVVAADLRVDSLGDHLGAEGARRGGEYAPAEGQRHAVGAADIQVVADEPLEERPPGGGTPEHPGIGHLELTERQLVDVAGAQVHGGEYLREPGKPAPEKPADRTGPEPVAQPLQQRGLVAGAEPVIQRGIPDPGLIELPLGPLVTVQPDPDRERRIAVDFPERRTPLRIP